MKDTANATNRPDRSGPGSTTTTLPTDEFQGGSDKSTSGTKPTIKMIQENFNIDTWNVRTLNMCGKVNELEHELKRYKWDIIGLAEMRWTGFGETNSEDGHKIYYSGEEKQHKYGVGFIVRKETTGYIMSCTPVSSRIISMRVSAKPKNITIIQVYAPSSDHEDQEVEEFYEKIENTIQKAPKKDLLIIQGDFNAKIGEDAYENWAGTVGRYGTGKTNDRGLRLLEFASSHQLTITNTLYPHKISRRTTWHAPNGIVHNQIDYILTPRRFKSSVNKAKTRTYPGADIGSDHDLVLLVMKMKLKKRQKPANPRIKFDLERLEDPEIAEIFEAKIGGRFAALNILDKDINELTTSFNEGVLETAEEVVGRQRKKHKPWVTNDILDLCDERREKKKEKYNSQEGAEEYRRANKLVRKKLKEAKENWIDEQCKNIEQSTKQGNTKKVHELVRTLTNTKQDRSMVIENRDGELLTEKEEVLKRWTEYCNELYNYPIQPDSSILEEEIRPPKEPSPLPVMREEVEEAIRSLPTGKSPGSDNIPAELIKKGGLHW